MIKAWGENSRDTGLMIALATGCLDDLGKSSNFPLIPPGEKNQKRRKGNRLIGWGELISICYDFESLMKA